MPTRVQCPVHAQPPCASYLGDSVYVTLEPDGSVGLRLHGHEEPVVVYLSRHEVDALVVFCKVHRVT